VFSYLSGDPADRHFRQIFIPHVAPVPAIKLAAQYADLASALHARERSPVRLVAYMTAFVTSVNRVTGAKRAHQALWIRRQRHAAARFAHAAAAILFGFQRQRDAVAAAYRSDGVSLTVSASAVQTAQSRVATQEAKVAGALVGYASANRK
jgi:hypothetical protein